jgi:hypothetical protein
MQETRDNMATSRKNHRVKKRNPVEAEREIRWNTIGGHEKREKI